MRKPLRCITDDKKKNNNQEYEIIDLTGPQGNAHYLMGRAIVLSKQLGIDSDSIFKI
jgi:hypothetical protein